MWYEIKVIEYLLKLTFNKPSQPITFIDRNKLFIIFLIKKNYYLK